MRAKRVKALERKNYGRRARFLPNFAKVRKKCSTDQILSLTIRIYGKIKRPNIRRIICQAFCCYLIVKVQRKLIATKSECDVCAPRHGFSV